MFTIFKLITGFVTRLTRRVPVVEQVLLTLPEHLSSPPVFSGVSATRSLVLYVCFVDRCLSFCTFWPLLMCCLFFFDIVIYGFWLPLWYLQTLIMLNLGNGCLYLATEAIQVWYNDPQGLYLRYLYIIWARLTSLTLDGTSLYSVYRLQGLAILLLLLNNNIMENRQGSMNPYPMWIPKNNYILPKCSD